MPSQKTTPTAPAATDVQLPPVNIQPVQPSRPGFNHWQWHSTRTGITPRLLSA